MPSAFAQYTGSGKDGYASAVSASEQAGADDLIDHLTFTTGVPDSIPNVAFSPQPVISIRDIKENVVNSTLTVTLSILNDSGGSSTLGGTTSIAASAGAADFANQGLKIDKPG